MSAGFLGRLANRALGLGDTAGPLRPPLFAALRSAGPNEVEQVVAATPQIDQTAPPLRVEASPTPILTPDSVPAAAVAIPVPSAGAAVPHIRKEGGREPREPLPPASVSTPFRPRTPVPTLETPVATAPPPAPLGSRPTQTPPPNPSQPVAAMAAPGQATAGRLPPVSPSPPRDHVRLVVGERHRTAEPAIHVSIGEVVVRVEAEEKRTPPAGRPAATRPNLTLEQYLRRRDGMAG
jgi:hypothetical protein